MADDAAPDMVPRVRRARDLFERRVRREGLRASPDLLEEVDARVANIVDTLAQEAIEALRAENEGRAVQGVEHKLRIVKSRHLNDYLQVQTLPASPQASGREGVKNGHDAPEVA